ncbi:Predicted arabinose efflux permease, MFS family [Halovenus aranensis]|jgi:MFS family permease|uniref:Predicted arabinose efflux permease, MFS family n=1 Tax=Halovenus aranensis TaxID=890420 RepID=A0A1G8W692_9EURY|nr:MFS transporter [Halovenus aranensis]SDJ73802.1 Predicted arabinose efflux permease, MFS family [Halovenus aranensis]
MSLITSIRAEAASLLGEGKGKVLGPVAVGWGLLVGTRMVYPVVLPSLQEMFGLSLSTAGLLVTVLWLGSAVGQLPSGVLTDRYTERRMMVTGTVTVATALSLVVVAPTPILLYCATALVGVGLSLYPIARITILTETYPDRLGSALGVTMATGDLGQTVFPPLAGVLTAVLAWQFGFGVMIPLLLTVGLTLWVTLPDTSTNDTDETDLSVERLRYILSELRSPALVFMTVVLFLFIFVWQTFSAFYPTYLADEKGLSDTMASALFGLFFGFGVVVKPLAGSAYDRIGMRRSLVAVLVGPVAGLVLLPFVDGIWPLVGITALVSSMLGTGAITQSYLSELFADDMRGTGLGVVRTTAATLGASGPVLFGIVADRGYFDEGYLALAGVMAVIILLTLRMPGR